MIRPKRWRFRVGTVVTVKGGRTSARIESRHPELAHGAVRLDRPLVGIQWWNEEELVRRRRRKPTR